MDDMPALSVAFAPGVTVTKWTRIWAERHPDVPLTLLPTDQSEQVEVVFDGLAQLSFVRLPIDSDGLHVIQLYRESVVAVAAKDHLIAAASAVTLAELAGETQLSVTMKHGDRSAFDLVAAGVGVLVVPQSIARLYSRKDVVVRPVTDGAQTQIALVWRVDRASDAGSDTGPDVHASRISHSRAALIEEFIGIVRGRTSKSSRSAAPQGGSSKKERPAKSGAKGSTNGSAKANRITQRSSAGHAASRKRAESRKKHRGH